MSYIICGMQGQPNSVSKGETMFMSPKFSLKKDQIDWNSNALFYGKDMNFPYQKLFDLSLIHISEPTRPY